MDNDRTAALQQLEGMEPFPALMAVVDAADLFSLPEKEVRTNKNCQDNAWERSLFLERPSSVSLPHLL